jgi:hypothetical protein
MMSNRSLAWLTLLMVATLGRPAAAGAYCGSVHGIAPADGSTLPVAPTIAVSVEDYYYAESRKNRAAVPPLRITLNGKPVTFSARTVRTGDGLIRLITIKSRKTGTLAVGMKSRWEKAIVPYATYTIVNEWNAPETPTATVGRDVDSRLGPYRRLGYRVAVSVDVPAIAFTLRWRRTADGAWKVLQLPAAIIDGSSVAHIGETMCGMTQNVPLADITAGIDVELSAMLPDGRSVAITTGVPRPLALPPKPEGSYEPTED